MGEAVGEDVEQGAIAGEPGQPMGSVVGNQGKQAVRVAGLVHDGRQLVAGLEAAGGTAEERRPVVDDLIRYRCFSRSDVPGAPKTRSERFL